MSRKLDWTPYTVNSRNLVVNIFKTSPLQQLRRGRWTAAKTFWSAVLLVCFPWYYIIHGIIGLVSIIVYRQYYPSIFSMDCHQSYPRKLCQATELTAKATLRSVIKLFSVLIGNCPGKSIQKIGRMRLITELFELRTYGTCLLINAIKVDVLMILFQDCSKWIISYQMPSSNVFREAAERSSLSRL
ncbi:hypothetical protein GQX74_014025 [Glossina fuscipes]|nr:hypothetical protein GQX74_014025 [Glossina fuscipes]